MDIVCACDGELDLTKFPCKATDYGYPTKLLLQDTDGDLTVAGESPTLAEVQTGIADSGENKLIVIEEITNGQLVESSREEETGADTADGLTDVFNINMAVTGNVKLLDEDVRADLLTLNCRSRLKMWVITSKGYILGGATGYKIANFFSPMILGGFGTRASIPVNLVYRHNLKKTDPAGQNDGFLNLTNPAVS